MPVTFHTKRGLSWPLNGFSAAAAVGQTPHPAPCAGVERATQDLDLPRHGGQMRRAPSLGSETLSTGSCHGKSLGRNARKKYRKSCRPAELRALIGYFRNKGDRFSRWIAGYIQLSSRIGWRPALRREGKFLRAPAEKCTNERGLTDVCEVDISTYPARLIVELDQWIAQIDYWAKRYDGLWNLRVIINGRLATACAGLGISASCDLYVSALCCFEHEEERFLSI